MTTEEHSRAFTVFVAGLLADFDRYLAAGPPDLLRDGVSYSMGAMWLSDAEYTEFLRDVQTIVQPRFANAPRKGRRRRLVWSVFLPAREEPSRGRAARDQRPVAGTEGRNRPPSRTDND